MHRFLAALMMGAAATPLATPLAAPVAAQSVAHNPVCESIQVRFEREGAPPDSRHYVRPDTNLRVALNYAAIIDGHDIDSLHLERSYEDTARRDVIAKLTPAGAAALRRATGSHVGRHIAVVLGDEITYYAVIASATAGRIVTIATGLERTRAAALLARAERARRAHCPAG